MGAVAITHTIDYEGDECININRGFIDESGGFRMSWFAKSDSPYDAWAEFRKDVKRSLKHTGIALIIFTKDSAYLVNPSPMLEDRIEQIELLLGIKS